MYFTNQKTTCIVHVLMSFSISQKKAIS